MRLSSQTDFALRILIRLAASPEELVATPDIARAYGLSYSHLNKIVTMLARHGYLEVKRGRTGGARLAIDPASINIGDVIRRFERMDLVECLDEERNTCLITPACRLTSVLQEGIDAFLGSMDRHTLADVMRGREVALGRLFAKHGEQESPGHGTTDS